MNGPRQRPVPSLTWFLRTGPSGVPFLIASGAPHRLSSLGNYSENTRKLGIDFITPRDQILHARDLRIDLHVITSFHTC
jgi:hypothetical protein